MNIVIVVFIVIVLALIVVYRLYKHYECIVCTEACNVFSSMISMLDQLCAINNDIKVMWKQVMFNYSLTGNISYETARKYKDTVLYKKKELDEILKINPSLKFHDSAISRLVLSRHKLTVGEVCTSDTFLSATVLQLKELMDKVYANLDTKQVLQSNLMLIDAEIDCFQLEACAGFYGAMEGLCTFPESAKVTYLQLYPRIKHLPIEIGHNRRKEEYSFLQDQSYDEAEKRIRGVKDAMGFDEKFVEEYANTVLHKDVNFFFAGAKSLQEERDMFANIISQLQTNNRDSLISIYGYSYQNFDHKLIDGGHEEEYCNFIRNNTDSIIFVLNENIGEYTLLELNVALESFKQTGTPNIFVYTKETNNPSSIFNDAKRRVDKEKQFWVDYKDKQQLRLLIERDLLLRLSAIERSIENERKKIMS